MGKGKITGKTTTKKSIIDRIFPVKYDFYYMLHEQARVNAAGVNALYNWLGSGSEDESMALVKYVNDADDIRMDLEMRLIEAFTTPFDRGDIYSISVAMDKTIEYTKSTLLSMQEFDVKSNDTIIKMTEKLKEGMDIFSESIKELKDDPFEAGRNIAKIRLTHVAVEQLYRNGMAIVFKDVSDPMFALKHREVYHHIKDASSNLEYAVDILHRIVIRLT